MPSHELLLPRCGWTAGCCHGRGGFCFCFWLIVLGLCYSEMYRRGHAQPAALFGVPFGTLPSLMTWAVCT